MKGVRSKLRPGRRPRCPACGKVRFATREMAQARLDYLITMGTALRRVYPCADTAWYHLTKKG